MHETRYSRLDLQDWTIELTGLCIDYTLANPDNLTKWKTAASISEKVLAAVSQLCVAGEKIITICQKGDKLIEEEVAKVYRTTKYKGTLLVQCWCAAATGLSTENTP